MKANKFLTFLFIALGLPAMAASTAHADEKFIQMDTSKDGKVTWDEFHKAYPQMQQGAFDAIDANKDKVLSHEEWDAFLAQHSMGRANAPAGMGGGMGAKGGMGAAPDTKGEGPAMMITPPAK